VSGTSAGSAQHAVASVQQMMSAVPAALQSLATPAPAASLSDVFSSLNKLSDLITIGIDLPANILALTVALPLALLGIVSLPLDIGGYGTGVHTDQIVSGWAGVQPWPGEEPAPVQELPAPLTNLPVGTVPPPRISVGVGEANTVGALSVPATWTIATPLVRPVSFTLPALPAGVTSTTTESVPLVTAAAVPPTVTWPPVRLEPVSVTVWPPATGPTAGDAAVSVGAA
jgi:hypothetical protein